MRFRLAIVVAVSALTLAHGTADACGYKPECKPKPTPPPCVCPTDVPTVAPTPVPTVVPTPVPPTVVPPAPVQFSVTPLPVATAGVPASGPVPGPAATGGGPINSPRLSEYCHYEPSTGNWEIRHSTDVDKMVRLGEELPIGPNEHVCDQHQPLHPPFVESVVESVPDVAQPTPEIVELPPVVVELPMADEPVVTPAEEAPITVDEVTVTVPESVPVCVPVQIPGDEPC